MIGFGKNENGKFPGQGLMANVSIKYGPDACKWSTKYLPNTDCLTYNTIDII